MSGPQRRTCDLHPDGCPLPVSPPVAVAGAQEVEGLVRRKLMRSADNGSVVLSWEELRSIDSELARLREAAQGAGGPHPDDEAVDKFAAAMKAKLAKKRAEGRHGWDNPEVCEVSRLADLLVDHCAKVNSAVDIGNFAMMIWNRTEGADHKFIPEALLARSLRWRDERAGGEATGQQPVACRACGFSFPSAADAATHASKVGCCKAAPPPQQQKGDES